MLRSAKLTAISLAVINPAYLETNTETVNQRGILDMEKIRRAIETKEIDLTNEETLEQVKKLLEEIKAALPAEKQKDTADKEPEEKPAETKEPEKADEPKVETPEQPETDTQTEETKSEETEPDPEQQKKLEELQREIEKELSDN